MHPRRSGSGGRQQDSDETSAIRMTSLPTPPTTSRDRQPSDTAVATSTRTTKTSGAYGGNFASLMRHSGIHLACVPLLNRQPQPKPKNFETLQVMLRQRRTSMLSSHFTQEEFERFQQTQFNARGRESKVMRTVVPYIQGGYVDPECVEEGMPFNNMANMLSHGDLYAPRPDLCYGAPPGHIATQMRAELGSHVVPSTVGTRPIAPNCFIEIKSTHGSGDVARHQIAMAGAAGARAMHSWQTYGGDVDAYDGNAYTLSLIYIDGSLTLYAHYPAQPGGPGTAREYYMHQLSGYHLTSDRKTAAEGIAAVRNAKDWTEAQRNAMIARANAAAGAAAQYAEERALGGDATGSAQECANKAAAAACAWGRKAASAPLHPDRETPTLPPGNLIALAPVPTFGGTATMFDEPFGRHQPSGRRFIHRKG